MVIVGSDIVAIVTGGVLEIQDVVSLPVSSDPTFYNSIAAIAEDLINAYGRDITFIRFNQTKSDSDKPWLEPADVTLLYFLGVAR